MNEKHIFSIPPSLQKAKELTLERYTGSDGRTSWHGSVTLVIEPLTDLRLTLDTQVGHRTIQEAVNELWFLAKLTDKDKDEHDERKYNA